MESLTPPTILVVEDNPDDAAVVEMTFKEVGFQNPLQFVEDGAEAVAYLNGEGQYADREVHPIPLLVVLDINLPMMNGFEVMEATREVRDEHRVKVVILSVSDSDEDRLRAHALGATKMLQKPIEPQRLLETVSEIGAFGLLIVARS